jgi:phage internal scaffolding protein
MPKKKKQLEGGRKHPRVVLDCSASVDRTKQSMKDECDVNGIIGRFAKTGLLTPVNKDPGIYVDVSEMGDYKESLHQVDMANEMFMQLPAVVRAKFENDPAVFLDYASDETNNQDMVDMGLMPGTKTSKRAKARALRAEDDVVVTDINAEGD